MGKYVDLPIGTKLFENLDEAAITSSYAAIENAFVNEAQGISRIPGMRLFADFGGGSPVYLGSINNDLIAASGDGRVRRLDKNAQTQEFPGPPVLGGRRVIFTKDRSQIYMAAGARIIACDGTKLSVLSDDAPLASHIGFTYNFMLANQIESEFFFNSGAGTPASWNALDVFAADSKPDNITALLITDFGEIIIAGPQRIEQYDRITGAAQPFIRRWAVGDGISEPYTLIFADNAVWGLNQFHEFTRYSGQTGEVVSGDIEKPILSKFSAAHLDSFTDAWAAPLYLKGQTYLLLQFPQASNEYGSKGVSYILDVRQNKWAKLFGWDAKNNIPAIWPGVSVARQWGRTYIGGLGKIYEMTDDAYNTASAIQRLYLRTAHYNELGLMRIDRLRLTMKRGAGSNTASSTLGMRVNKNAKGFGPWQFMDLGKAGDRDFVRYYGAQGEASTFQFEFMVTDDCPVEIRKIEAETTPLVR